MFAYIKGNFEDITPQGVILEVGGIGYEIKVPESLIQKLPDKGTMVKLHTYFNVREDTQELYGFYNKEEKAIFEKLITVSGIGPRVSMAILSVLSPSQLAIAITTGDIKTLCMAPGVGKKTAQRMILELKEKIDKESLVSGEGPEELGVAMGAENEAIEALVALGYQPQEAKGALNSIEDKDQDVSALIKLSLKMMDKR